MNTLLVVILRFRQGAIAVMAHIEGMFHQVKVPKKDIDFLGFLCWPNGDIEVCIMNNFYVEDCLKSISNERQDVMLVLSLEQYVLLVATLYLDHSSSSGSEVEE